MFSISTKYQTSYSAATRADFAASSALLSTLRPAGDSSVKLLVERSTRARASLHPARRRRFLPLLDLAYWVGVRAWRPDS